MRFIRTVACTFLKAAWQAVCRPFCDQFRRLSPLRSGSLRSALIIFLPSLAPLHAADRPNVVIFLVDDMGWMDSGVYGSKYYETPDMDRLAARSMRFTHAYAQARRHPDTHGQAVA